MRGGWVVVVVGGGGGQGDKGQLPLHSRQKSV